MKRIVFLLDLFIVSSCFAQDIFTFSDFTASLAGRKLTVVDNTQKTVFERLYFNPIGYLTDLDQDGNNELVISDSKEVESQNYYTLYVYNTMDTFYQVDSVYSGLKEPYYDYSDEVQSLILITGSPDFDSLNSDNIDFIFSPIVCWNYDGNELNIINDQLSNVFLVENERYINIMDSVYKDNGTDCNSTRLLVPVIAATYANYLNASENANAEKVLVTYYLCDDRNKFREKLKKLL